MPEGQVSQGRDHSSTEREAVRPEMAAGHDPRCTSVGGRCQAASRLSEDHAGKPGCDGQRIDSLRVESERACDRVRGWHVKPSAADQA